jgi:hypothetical protein
VQSGAFSLVDQKQPVCYNSSSIIHKGADVDFDIEFINETAASVDYSTEAVAEYKATGDSVIEKYTEIFETEHIVAGGEDIGGLIVYSQAGQLQAVYDYENFCGWVV